MKPPISAIILSFLILPSVACAGPPFLTDDPEPTETGHWEIYGPLIEVDGKRAEYQGAVAAEFNYGIAPDVQVTVEIPVVFGHEQTATKWGAGDIALSVKYRFYTDEDAELSVAAFPGLTLPTANNGLGSGKVTALLPVWAQKNWGPWSIFGGGGYAINPGVGNRDYWTGGIAVSRQMSPKLLIGIEADRQGADTRDGSGSTSLGVGAIYRLKTPFRLLVSGGPTFDDNGGTPGFHAFAALGLDF